MKSSVKLGLVAAVSMTALSFQPLVSFSNEPPLIPERHWNDTAKLWLARAMVSEAGWEETRDHVAIAYVLFRRWIVAKREHPHISLTAVIKRYCAGFGNTIPTARQRWVLTLRADGGRPAAWPNDIAWVDYKDRWLAVLNTVEQWRRGEHPDPCNGLARYWGGPMDRPSPRMIRMDCGETKNRFYTVRTLLPPKP